MIVKWWWAGDDCGDYIPNPFWRIESKDNHSALPGAFHIKKPPFGIYSIQENFDAVFCVMYFDWYIAIFQVDAFPLSGTDAQIALNLCRAKYGTEEEVT